MGRPVILDADMIMDICEDVANGKTLTAAARLRDVTGSAVRKALLRDETLFQISVRARESGCDALADQCIQIADDPKIGAADKRIRIDTRIRLIGKWSSRYSDRVTVTNNTTVTHRYDLDSLDDARLGELERILADASRSEGGESKALPPPLH